jgi:hypothetical protein
MTPEERLAYLLEPVFVPTNAGVVLRDIYNAAGEYESLVAITIYQVRHPVLAEIAEEQDRFSAMALAEQLNQACMAMSNPTGLLLSDAKSQSLVDILSLLGSWPDSVRDAVKALGGVDRFRWQSEGYEVTPTLESVTLAMTKETLEDAAKDALQAYREALSAWDGTGDAPVLGG